jgi:hypothetical protein
MLDVFRVIDAPRAARANAAIRATSIGDDGMITRCARSLADATERRLGAKRSSCEDSKQLSD